MCGPLAIGLQGLGALSSANAAQGAAESSKIQLNASAALGDINARMSELSAQSAILAGQREEQKSRLATANLKSRQRVSMAANGIDLGVGTGEQILTSTDLMGEIDADTIRGNAIKSAWGYRTQGVNQQSQARMQRASADAINPGQAFTTSLIGSASQVAASWYRGTDWGTKTPTTPAKT